MIIRYFGMISKLLGAFVILAAGGNLGGCGRELVFTVVDADTLVPIGAAKVQVDEERFNMILPYRHEHRDARSVSGDGICRLNDVPTTGGWTTHVLFEAPGYFDAGCAYTTGESIVNETKINIYNEVSREAEIGRGLIMVKMFRAPPGERDLKFHRLGTHFEAMEGKF